MTGRERIGLGVLMLLFLAWHVPLIFRTEAGLDEDWYGVPGVTILRTGLPQIPYIPSRDPASACYKADVILDALPPLAFYLQAILHLVLGPGIGAARMTSVLAGLLACYLVHDLARLWFGGGRCPLVAAAVYLAARAFYFPATTARPDMVAVAFGLLAVAAAVRHCRDPQHGKVLLAGVAAGLSMLSHPFGIVPAAQVGLALLAGPPQNLGSRLRGLALFTTAALLCFALWLPLILLHPDIFRVQFGNNVLGRAGPGLGVTLLAPWSIVVYQLVQIGVFLQPLQAGVYVLALVFGTVLAWHAPGARGFVYHHAASWLLLILFEGKHPTLGYYAYPAALASIALGLAAARTMAAIERAGGNGGSRLRSTLAWGVVAALLLSFAPGAGLRTLAANIRHLGDPAYDAHAVARAVLGDIPPQALTAVDGAFVLDFYLAGRPVLEATIHRLSYDFRSRPFEYLVFARDGLRRFLPRMDSGELTRIRTYGDRSDPFAPYAELFRRRSGGRTATTTAGLGARRADGTIRFRPPFTVPDTEERRP